MSGDDRGDEARFWPLRWVTDEKFWRDVTAQAVGTFAVLFVGFIWAATAGWLNPSMPVAAARWGAVGVGVVLAVVGAVLTIITVGSAREMQRREGTGRRYAICIGALSLFLLALVAVPYVVGLVRGTMFGAAL